MHMLFFLYAQIYTCLVKLLRSSVTTHDILLYVSSHLNVDNELDSPWTCKPYYKRNKKSLQLIYELKFTRWLYGRSGMLDRRYSPGDFHSFRATGLAFSSWVRFFLVCVSCFVVFLFSMDVCGSYYSTLSPHQIMMLLI